MKDLTKGKPSTLILAFALPIFFANLLQLTYSLVDTRIVGTFLGEDALAAVGRMPGVKAYFILAGAGEDEYEEYVSPAMEALVMK
mgnify:CR=1 FL=1